MTGTYCSKSLGYGYYLIAADSLIILLDLDLLLLVEGLIIASATISDISATLVFVTGDRVFLQRGQDVARQSGFCLVSSAATEEAIVRFPG